MINFLDKRVPCQEHAVDEWREIYRYLSDLNGEKLFFRL